MEDKGRPLSIVYKSEKTKNFELNEEALESVLLRRDVKDKPVCVVAAAGAFRKGKSFLLDFMLRYCANQNKANWLGDPSDPLEGFRWANGYERETTGMLIWSEPFFVKSNFGEEVAIILIDTQGTFDSESSMRESTAVFALSLLVSSVLVYNLMGNIQEDDLMNLQTFINYGLCACTDDESAAFQKVLFLVRDWNSPAKLAYGLPGGQQLLKARLEIKSEQDPAHQDLRRDISKCFSDINCYLMPHPGRTVARDEEFDGKHAEIDDEFLAYLNMLMPLVLAPENIVKKTGLRRQTIKAKDLFLSFKSYVNLFNSEDLPQPTTLVESMAEASGEAALAEGKELYDQEMYNVVTMNYAYDLRLLKASHKRLQQQALVNFNKNISYGGKQKDIFQRYQNELKKATDGLYTSKYKPIAKSQAALENSKEYYCKEMNSYFEDEKAVLTEDQLKDKHLKAKNGAISNYEVENVFGKKSSDVYRTYQDRLKTDIEDKYKQYTKDNEDRRHRQKALQELDDALRSKRNAQIAAVAGLSASLAVLAVSSGAIGGAASYLTGSTSVKTAEIGIISEKLASVTAKSSSNVISSTSSYASTASEYLSFFSK